MTPLLMTETATVRSGSTASASDATIPKGDGEFADLVDATDTQEETLPKPAEDPSLVLEDVNQDVNPDIAVTQPDVQLTPERAAGSTNSESPKSVVVKVPELAKDMKQTLPDADAQPDETPQNAKDPRQPDKAAPAVKSTVQAIMEGRMPVPQADSGVKPEPRKPVATSTELPVNDDEPVTMPRVPVISAADQSLQGKGVQVPVTQQATAFPTTPKVTRDVEPREVDKEPALQSAETIRQSSGPSAPVVNTPVLASAPTIMLDLQKQATNKSFAEGDVLSGSGLGERAGASGVQTAATGPSSVTTAPAQQVAHQIAAAITQTGGRVTEIALNPEELGRVRLSMTAQETTITLNVLAERPETTELLRRNIDALTQEFRALGYNDINFSFGGDGAAQAETEDAPDQQKLTTEVSEDSTTPTALQPMSGLDLRM